MLFILFSLAPCSIKSTLFHTVDVSYTKTLNISKTAFQTADCQNPIIVKKIAKTIPQAQFIDDNLTLSLIEFVSEISSTRNISDNYTGYTLQNNPPLYILFNQLKIDMV